jgi:hypothetical protein
MEFVGRVARWLVGVPAPEDGPGMVKYVDEKRLADEPWIAAEPRQRGAGTGPAQHSRWTGEPLGAAAGMTQSGIGQSH